jgi:hypothetical protein
MALELLEKDFYTPGSGYGNYDLYYDKTTGKTELKQNFGTAILFQDGTFYMDAVQIPELSSNGVSVNTQKAKDLDSNIKTKIRTASQQQKGVLPKWAETSNQNAEPVTNNNYPGTNPGISSAIAGGMLSSPPGQFYDTIKKLNFSVPNEKSVLGGETRYPIDIDITQDTFQISQYNYKAPLENDFLKGNITNILKEGSQRGSALKGDLIGTVILPIPAGISDSNSVQWGPDNINDLSVAAASLVNKDPFLQGLGSLITGAGANLGGVDPASARKIQFLLQFAGAGGLDNPMIRPAVVSKILSSVGFDVSPETILSRGFGIVPNSNMELLFSGPQLRGFTFVYKMTPRSQTEAKNVRKILRFFKQGMAPRKINRGGVAGGRSLFLSTPNVFKLNYKTHTNQSIKGLNKFKICALTNFGVQYAPDGWASYEDPTAPGQPVSVVMTMQFAELEPVYANDYTDNILTGPNLKNDLEAIGSDDIGY